MSSIKHFIILFLLLCFCWISCEQQSDIAKDFWASVKYIDEPEQEHNLQRESTTPSTQQQEKEQNKLNDLNKDDDFAEFQDDDEGFDSETILKNTQEYEKKKAEELKKKEEEKAKQQNPPPRFFNWPDQEHYYFEIIAIAGLICYGIKFWIGKQQNESIARRWTHSVFELFKQNFSSVASSEKFIVVKESQTEFRFYATGRVNCDGYIATLKLQNRHDIIWQIYDILFGSPRDTITIDIAINDDKMEPFILAVVPKKIAKDYKKENADIKYYATVTATLDALPNFVIFTDVPDLARKKLLTSEVTQTINKYEKYFDYFHFSDECIFYPNHTKTLRFAFKLPPPEKMDDLNLLMKMTFHFIDVIATTRLPPKIKDKNQQLRTQVKAALAKPSKEEIEKRNAEKKKEREERKRLMEAKKEEKKKK